MAPTDRTLRDGVSVGLIAYAAVAVFYAGFDVLAARETLYTVDLLGKIFFRGLREQAAQVPFQPDLPAIFLYNALHLFLSLCIGMTVAWLVDRADTSRENAYSSLFTLVAGFLTTVAMMGVLTAPIRHLLPIWSIVAANLYAMMLAGIYLVWRRPGIWRRLLPFLRRVS